MDCMRNTFVPGVLLDGRFRTVSPLNHGSFGMVFKAYDTVLKRHVALKCVTKSTPASGCPSALAVDDNSEELAIHRQIGQHRNVVNLIHSFETQHHIYLVLEYCANGDLYEAIRVGKGPGQTETIRDFMLQLISAVEHMHSKGVYHRDIKPENIFLSQNGDVKLGDFGLATSDSTSTEYAVGSDRYMAPEQYDHNGTGYDPAKADIWSIGICLLNILFSRNPFIQPTATDPLFRDFVTDRQMLFDVFLTMSYDTFEVLAHCLTLDPATRSFDAVKEALNRVTSFTTEDEALDDFCTEETPAAVVTANREPLRTPSISTPHLDNNGVFPWAKALAMSPPQTIRQLSAIPDTEFESPMFPGSQHQPSMWATDSKPDSASIASFVDSGLGVSLQSSSTNPPSISARPILGQRSKPVNISGSLPVAGARPIMNVHLSKFKDTVSKSWSDMVDEDEEALTSDVENSASFGFAAQLKAIKSKDWGYESSDGRSTPRNRVALSEVSPLSLNSSRNRSVQNLRELVDVKPARDVPNATDHISEHTGFVFEEHAMAAPITPRKTPVKKQSMPDLERWAKLGARRRGDVQVQVLSPLSSGQATPRAVKREADFKSGTTASTTPAPRKRSNTRVRSWRAKDRDFWVQTRDVRSAEYNGKDEAVPVTTAGSGKEWSRSKDWRQHSPTHLTAVSSPSAAIAVGGGNGGATSSSKYPPFYSSRGFGASNFTSPSNFSNFPTNFASTTNEV